VELAKFGKEQHRRVLAVFDAALADESAPASERLLAAAVRIALRPGDAPAEAIVDHLADIATGASSLRRRIAEALIDLGPDRIGCSYGCQAVGSRSFDVGGMRAA
jgi:hypothetical protein